MTPLEPCGCGYAAAACTGIPLGGSAADQLGARPDLTDRGLHIPDHNREDETSLLTNVERHRPRILGALLTAVSSAIRNLPTTHLAAKPRMADFATWVTAAEPGLGCPAGRFMDAYTGNRAAATELAVESSSIGEAIVEFMNERTTWQGGASELLAELDDRYEGNTRVPRDWPRNAQGLSSRLRRIAPAIRAVGIDISFQRTNKTRTVVLHKVTTTGIDASRASQTPF